MTQEDYVSFEIAKLLKNKGFDDVCHAFYDKDGIFINLLQFVGNSNFKGVNEEKITFAPTLQMAMKWLREERKINIEIITYWTKNKSMVYGNRIVHNGAVLKEIDTAYNSYEQACEAVIKYCLENLI